MAEKHGTLSIDSENLFPIIKKWLYSDHDIRLQDSVDVIICTNGIRIHRHRL